MTVLKPGDKLEIEGITRPRCDEDGRCGVTVDDPSKPNEHGEPTSITIGSDDAASCSTVYDWLDKTLSRQYLWDTDVKLRITVEVLDVGPKVYKHARR